MEYAFDSVWVVVSGAQNNLYRVTVKHEGGLNFSGI